MTTKREFSELLASKPEASLLLACLAPVDPREISALAAKSLDWPLFTKMAGWHSCIPHAWHALKSVDGIPKPASDALRSEFIGSTLKNTLKARELVRLMTSLEEAGVECLALKGPALATMLYGDLSMRQFSDLDILVARRDAEQAADILESQNYLPRRFRAFRPVESVRRYTEDEFINEDRALLIDLHWELAPSHFPFGPRAEQVWQDAREIKLDGAPIKTLSPSDTLLFLSVHHSKHGWVSLGWVADVAQLIRKYPEQDTAALIRRAEPLGCARMLRLGLVLAHELARAPLTSELRRECFADGIAVSLAWRIASRMFPTIEARPSLFNDWMVPLQTIARSRDRLRYVIQRALTPTIDDREFLDLPDYLAPLYTLLRPLRLAVQQGRRLIGAVPPAPPVKPGKFAR